MKATVYLIAAAIAAPAAVLLGAPVALVAGVAVTSGLAAIALGDYGRPALSYNRAATTAKAVERHALAA